MPDIEYLVPVLISVHASSGREAEERILDEIQPYGRVIITGDAFTRKEADKHVTARKKESK